MINPIHDAVSPVLRESAVNTLGLGDLDSLAASFGSLTQLAPARMPTEGDLLALDSLTFATRWQPRLFSGVVPIHDRMAAPEILDQT